MRKHRPAFSFWIIGRVRIEIRHAGGIAHALELRRIAIFPVGLAGGPRRSRPADLRQRAALAATRSAGVDDAVGTEAFRRMRTNSRY